MTRLYLLQLGGAERDVKLFIRLSQHLPEGIIPSSGVAGVVASHQQQLRLGSRVEAVGGAGVGGRQPDLDAAGEHAGRDGWQVEVVVLKGLVGLGDQFAIAQRARLHGAVAAEIALPRRYQG